MARENAVLQLSNDHWWRELDRLQIEGELPNELAGLLKSLILATVHSAIPPEATEGLIALAKEHLSGGIRIGEKLYDIMVYDPYNLETHRLEQKGFCFSAARLLK